MRNVTVGFGGLLMLLASLANADAPLSTPAEVRVLSNNRAYTVVSAPESSTRILDNKTQQVLWSMPGWYRSIYISNDGLHAATGYGGLSLIPLDYSEDLVIITFWEKGKLLKEVTLKEVCPEKTTLIRTASHYLWGNLAGVDAQDRLVVHRVDGKVLKFDMQRGKSVGDLH